MASTYLQRWSDPPPGQSRRRGGAMLLAIIAHIFVILLLLRLSPLPADHERSGAALKTFEVAAEKPATTATKKAKAAPKQQAHAAAAAPRPNPIAQPSRLHTDTTSGADASAIWALGRGLYKGSDIAVIPSAKRGDADTEAADAGNGGVGDSQSIGAGPGGRLMYNAEWYREPSEAEMRTYLPRQAAPGDWGVIICQTAPRYRVENCRELEQSPPGVGISRALRQASFQFKVMPPRVNGKEIMGAWVKIRFYIVDGGMSPHR